MQSSASLLWQSNEAEGRNWANAFNWIVGKEKSSRLEMSSCIHWTWGEGTELIYWPKLGLIKKRSERKKLSSCIYIFHWTRRREGGFFCAKGCGWQIFPRQSCFAEKKNPRQNISPAEVSSILQKVQKLSIRPFQTVRAVTHIWRRNVLFEPIVTEINIEKELSRFKMLPLSQYSMMLKGEIHNLTLTHIC